MTSDLRYLVFLNLVLVAIMSYAAITTFQRSQNSPKGFDRTSIEARIEAADATELKELSSTLTSAVENRIGAVQDLRKRVAILLGFGAIVAGSNLWMIFWILRKSRRGLYVRDGVMLETQ